MTFKTDNEPDFYTPDRFPTQHSRTKQTQRDMGKCLAVVAHEFGVSITYAWCDNRANPGDLSCGIHNEAADLRRKQAADRRYQARRETWKAKKKAGDERRHKVATWSTLVAALRQIEAGANDARAIARDALAPIAGDASGSD